MAKKTPLSRRNAAPEKQLVTTASNEFMRRYKNVSRELPIAEIERVIGDYAKDLQRGGFNQPWVMQVLKAATIGYARKVASQIQGGAPINRPGSYNREERLAAQLGNNQEWFKYQQNKVSNV